QLDGIVNRDAFDDRPDEARGLDFRFALEDFVMRPSLAAIDVMQSRDDARRARLLDLIERNQVLRAEPSPCFFHVRIVLHFDAPFARSSAVSMCIYFGKCNGACCREAPD